MANARSTDPLYGTACHLPRVTLTCHWMLIGDSWFERWTGTTSAAEAFVRDLGAEYKYFNWSELTEMRIAFKKCTVQRKRISNRDSLLSYNYGLEVRHCVRLMKHVILELLHRASCGAVYCNWSCLWVDVFVCGWVCYHDNCYHDNSKLCASIFTKPGL